MSAPPAGRPAPPRGLVLVATLVLFVIWSNSFVAMSYVLGSERASRRLDFVSLTSARFLPVTLVCVAYLLACRRAEALACFRAHGPRLLLCGTLAVPVYSLTLYYGIQHGVPAPIASLITALSPLCLLAFGAAFLREPLTLRKVAGFVVCVGGLGALAWARGADGLSAAAIAIAAIAPVGWAVHTAISKPLAARVPPGLWTACYLVAGGLPLLCALPWAGGPGLVALDGIGWAAVLYLSLACTLLGFASWAWLLQHLPASSVGLTVFLNPPLTFASQKALTVLFPGTFRFDITATQALGSAVVLAGLAVAVTGRRGGR